MMRRETSAEIEEAAVLWLSRLDRVPLGGDGRHELERSLQEWLAVDTRHLGAYVRAQATMLRLDAARALGPHYDPNNFLANSGDTVGIQSNFNSRPFSRRAMIRAGGTAIALGALGAGALLTRSSALYFSSDGGKIRRLALEDGTIIHLNAASMIEVRFSPKARTVLLSAGEALFDVVKDVDRPFIVMAGQTTLRALDSVFSVRRQMGAAVRIMVRRGLLDVQRGANAGTIVQLRPNMLAQVDEDQGVPLRITSIDHADLDSGLSWLEGNLTFRGATLGDAAQEFSRYNGQGVLDIAPSLRAHRISGAFAGNDPEGFARAIATSYGLQVKYEGRTIKVMPRDEQN